MYRERDKVYKEVQTCRHGAIALYTAKYVKRRKPKKVHFLPCFRASELPSFRASEFFIRWFSCGKQVRKTMTLVLIIFM